MIDNKKKFTEYIGKKFNHIPVCKQIPINKLTPLNCYLKVANCSYSYLLESIPQGEKGRYSVIGIKANTLIKIIDNDLWLLNKDKVIEQKKMANPIIYINDFIAKFKVPKLDNMPDFYGGLVGYLGYETTGYFENKIFRLKKPDRLNVPDIFLMLSNDLVVFDNIKQVIYIVTHINPNEKSYSDAKKNLIKIEHKITNCNIIPKIKYNSTTAKSEFISEFGEEKYKKAVNSIKEYIIKGDVMQVVISQRFFQSYDGDSIALYNKLRKINPSPYMYYLDYNDFQVVGSSPEILTKVRCGSAVVRPIAGTRPRGVDKKEDLLLEKELLADKKEMAEHLMLIDLGRNDLGRIAKVNTIKLTEKTIIERYSHVMHIVSNISCKVRENINIVDILRAVFPTGTVSGAPKIRAMQIIDELEPIKRNIYAGAVGYFSWHNNIDLAIAIRTAVIKNNNVYIQSGAGIVFDSVIQNEWQESLNKAKVFFKAINELKNS